MKNRKNIFYIMFLFFAILSNGLLGMEDNLEEYYKQGSMGFEPETPSNIGKNIVPFPSEYSWSFDKERNK